MEVDVLHKLLREDSARSHRWGHSGNGLWVYSAAQDATITHKMQCDLAAEPDTYHEFERQTIAAGNENLRIGPSGASWLTPAGEAFGREAADYWRSLGRR